MRAGVAGALKTYKGRFGNMQRGCSGHVVPRSNHYPKLPRGASVSTTGAQPAVSRPHIDGGPDFQWWPILDGRSKGYP